MERIQKKTQRQDICKNLLLLPKPTYPVSLYVYYNLVFIIKNKQEQQKIKISKIKSKKSSKTISVFDHSSRRLV